MPRTTSDIGSSGLEQGGGNLGNDYSRPVTTDRNEQNTTTNVGSHPSEGSLSEEDNGNIQDREITEGDGSGSIPDPETLKEDDQAH